MASLSLALRFPPTLNPKPQIRLFFPPLTNSSLRPPPLPSAFPRRRTPLVAVPRAVGDGSPEEEARGESTLPERFWHLTTEVPSEPVRWPWLIAVAFLVYAWRTVLWELSNWKKGGIAVLQFAGYIGKVLLAFIFHFIGEPLTAVIQCIEFFLNFVRSIYSSIVSSAPVSDLTTIILLTSAVLAIAEVTAPNSLNEQQYLLSAAGLAAFGLLSGFVPEILFLLILISFFCYSKFIKKKDAVSASLPSAAVLVAISEPWARTVIILGYVGLAIFQHSKSLATTSKEGALIRGRRLPAPLFLVALSVGIHLAAKWIRYRHLTWMIV